jgi:hypothetical protein
MKSRVAVSPIAVEPNTARFHNSGSLPAFTIMKNMRVLFAVMALFVGFASFGQTVLSITRMDPSPTNSTAVNFSVVFESETTGVTASNFALDVTGTATGTIGTPTTGDDITWTVPLTAVSGDGNLSIDFQSDVEVPTTAAFSVGEAYVIDNTAPQVSSVTVPADGTYIIGQNLDFTVNWDETVLVTNTPRIALTIGASPVFANYVSGSNSPALLFRYTVQSGDLDSDGITVGALQLNGGTITDAAANSANLTLNSVGNTDDVLVDGVRPTVVDILRNTPATSPTNADEVVFYVNFSEVVTDVAAADFTITGTAAGDGAIGAVASVDGDTWSVEVTGLTSSNGTIGLAVVANGGLTDVAGNQMTSTAVSGTNQAYTIDNTAPDITGVTAPINGTYGIGANLDFTVTYDEAVIVTGTPRLELTIGAATVYANYFSGSTGANLVFRYTVQSGDLDADGITIEETIDLNGGTLADAADNAADLTFSAPTLTGVLVDGVAPSLTSVTGPADGTYIIGQNLDFTANFTENVTVSGTRIQLTIGAATVYATYQSGSGGSAIVYRYTVQSGDLDADGIETATSIDLNGGSIVDAGNNASSLTFSAPDLTGVLVEGVRPTVTSVVASPTMITDANIGGGNFTLTVTFSEAMNTGVTPAISFPTGGENPASTIAFASGAWSGGDMVYTATYDVSDAGVATANIDVRVETAQDVAGNAMLQHNAPDLFSIDTQNPTVVSVTPSPTTISDGTVGSSTFTLTIVFSENMNTGVAPAVSFPTEDPSGTITLNGGTSNWSSATTYVARYNVVDANTTLANVDVRVETAQDANGNVMGQHNAANNFNIDTQNPLLNGPFVLAASNAYVDITFTEPVYNSGGSFLSASNFAIFSFSNPNATGATAVSVSGLLSTLGDPLVGGETSIRVLLNITGTPDGDENFRVGPANGSSVYDLALNPMDAAQRTNVIQLNAVSASDYPQFLRARPNKTNTAIFVTFDRTVDRDAATSPPNFDRNLRYRNDRELFIASPAASFSITDGDFTTSDFITWTRASTDGAVRVGTESMTISTPNRGIYSYTTGFQIQTGQTVSLTLADETINAFTASTANAYDDDADGNIDRVRVTFPDGIDDATVTLANFSFNGHIPSSFVTGTANDNVIDLIFTTYTGTSVSGNLTYTAGSLRDDARFGIFGTHPDGYSVIEADGNLFTGGNILPVDAAGPVVLSARTRDINLNGRIDRVDVVFSEPIFEVTTLAAIQAGTTVGGYTVSGVAISGSTLQISLTEIGAGFDTWIRPSLNLATGLVRDAAMANNPVYNVAQVSDGAAPYMTVTPLTTNDASPALSGGVDDPTAIVLINIGSSSAPATNNGDGTWTLADNSITVPAPGTYNVTAIGVDVFGNTGFDATTNELQVTGAVVVVAPTFNECNGSGYHALGQLRIYEDGATNEGGFASGGTLVLLLPTGFEFNTSVTPTTGASTLNDITGVTFSYPGSSVLQINLTVPTIAGLDDLRIDGLQVRAVGSTVYTNQNMTRVGGTASILTTATSYGVFTSLAAEPALTNVLLNGTTSVTEHVAKILSTVIVNYNFLSGSFTDGEVLNFGTNATGQMVPGSDDGSSFRVYLLTGTSIASGNNITGQVSGATAQVNGTPTSAADYLAPFTLVANPGGNDAVWYAVPGGVINVDSGGDAQQTTADNTELNALTPGLYSYDVTVDNGTCESVPLRVKVLILDDLNNGRFAINTFADRTFIITDPRDTLLISQPAGHTVSVSGAGIILTNPGASKLIYYFESETVGLGVYPITMTVTNNNTGDQISRTVNYTVVPEDAFFDPDITEFCIDNLPQFLEFRDPTWYSSDPFNRSEQYVFDNWLNTNLPACCGIEWAASYGWMYFYNYAVENFNSNYGSYGFPFDPRTWNTLLHGGYGFGDPFDVPDGQVYTIYVERFREIYSPSYENSIERDYFQVYGRPIVNFNNFATAFCADESPFTIQRIASYGNGMTQLNPNDPFSFWSPILVVDQVSYIATGYMLYTESSPGSGIYDVLYQDFTATGPYGVVNTFNPADPNGDGDEVPDETGNYRLIYVTEPLTPAACEHSMTFDFVIYAPSPKPVLETPSGMTLSVVNVDEYLLEGCQNYSTSNFRLPGATITVTGSLSGFSGSAFINLPFQYFYAERWNGSFFEYIGYGYIASGDATSLTFNPDYLFVDLQVGDQLQIYDYNLGQFNAGTLATFSRATSAADVTWYNANLTPIASLENVSVVNPNSLGISYPGYFVAAETKVFYMSSTSLDGCESPLRKVTVDIKRYPPAPDLNITGWPTQIKQGTQYSFDFCIPESPGQVSPSAIPITTLDPNTTYRVQQHYVRDETRGFGGNYLYSVRFDVTSGAFQQGEQITINGLNPGVYGFSGNLMVYTIGYGFSNGASIVGLTSGATGTVTRGTEWGYDITGNNLPLFTIFRSNPGTSHSYQEIALSRVESVNQTSGFAGCNGENAWIYVNGWNVPSTPTAGDFQSNSLVYHVSEGGTLGPIYHTFINFEDEFKWYMDAGKTELISALTPGIPMTQATLSNLALSNPLSLDIDANLADQGDDGVNDVYYFYVTADDHNFPARLFNGCETNIPQTVTINVYAKKDNPLIVSDNSAGTLGQSPSFLDLNDDGDPGNDDPLFDYSYVVCVNEIQAALRFEASEPNYVGTNRVFRWYPQNSAGTSRGSLMYEGTQPTFADLQLSTITTETERYFEVVQVTDIIPGVYNGVESERTLVRVNIFASSDLTFTQLLANQNVCIDDVGTDGLGNIEVIMTSLGVDADPARLWYEVISGPTYQFNADTGHPVLDIEALHIAAGGDADGIGGVNTTHTVTAYYLQDNGGCQITNSRSFSVISKPDITFFVNGVDINHVDFTALYDEFCYDGATVSLAGTLVDGSILSRPTGGTFEIRYLPGGTFSSLSTSNNLSSFVPLARHNAAPGGTDPFKLQTEHEIRFTYVDGFGCEHSVTQSIFINPRPRPTRTQGLNQIQFSEICQGLPAQAFIEIYDPADGVTVLSDYTGYSFTWLVNGANFGTVFNSNQSPSITDLATNLNFNVTITNTDGCGVVVNELHQRQALPELNFVGITNNLQYCQQDGTLPVTMTTNTGTIAGVDLANLSYSVYSYRNDLGFGSGSMVEANSGDNVTVDLAAWHLRVAGTATLGGPATTHIITMTYVDATNNIYQGEFTNCSRTVDLTFGINPDPDITFLIDGFDVDGIEYCYNDPVVDLSGVFANLTTLGNVSGGSFSGNGVESSSNSFARFRPSAAHDANYGAVPAADRQFQPQSANIITFSYTDQFGCDNSVEKTLYVNPRPDAAGAPGSEIQYDALCRTYPINARIVINEPGTSNEVGSYAGYTFTWTDYNGNIYVVPNDNTVTFPGVDQPNVNTTVEIVSPDGCSIIITETDVQGFPPVPTFTYVGLTENSADGLDIYISEDNASLADGEVDYIQLDITGPTPVAPIVQTGPGIVNPAVPYNIMGLAAGEYTVQVTMRTPSGCDITSAPRIITILPIIPVDPQGANYLATFEAGMEGWYIEVAGENGKADNRVTSWARANTGTNRIFTNGVGGNGSNVLITNPNGAYGTNEISYVYSPAFDLTAFLNPALSFLRAVDFDNQRDGLIVQISHDDGRTWEVLGDFDLTSGIKWYNAQGVSAGPGEGGRFPEAGNSHAEQVGYTQADLDANGNPVWGEARHRIEGDYINNLTRFRIALSTIGGSKAGKGGFAFDDFQVFEINKVVLVEQFATTLTQASKDYVSFIQNGPPHVIDWEGGTQGLFMTYFTDFANNGSVQDELNATNRVDPGTRSTYYGLLDAPTTRVGGENVPFVLATNPEDFENGFDVVALSQEKFDVSPAVLYDQSSGTISIDVDFTSKMDEWAEVGFFAVVVEKTVTYNGGVYINEPIPYVVRKLLPGASGQVVSGTFTDGQIVNLSADWAIGTVLQGSYGVANGIRIIAFAQDMVTKEIYQSGFIDVTITAPGTLGVTDPLANKLNIYPNPANNQLNIEFDSELENTRYWKMYDQAGRLVLQGAVERGNRSAGLIDTRSLPSGMYMVQIHDDKDYLTVRKVVIQH